MKHKYGSGTCMDRDTHRIGHIRFERFRVREYDYIYEHIERISDSYYYNFKIHII